MVLFGQGQLYLEHASTLFFEITRLKMTMTTDQVSHLFEMIEGVAEQVEEPHPDKGLEVCSLFLNQSLRGREDVDADLGTFIDDHGEGGEDIGRGTAHILYFLELQFGIMEKENYVISPDGVGQTKDGSSDHETVDLVWEGDFQGITVLQQGLDTLSGPERLYSISNGSKIPPVSHLRGK